MKYLKTKLTKKAKLSLRKIQDIVAKSNLNNKKFSKELIKIRRTEDN